MTVAVDTRTLASAINDEHRSCETSYRHALAHAFEAGRMLLEVKSTMDHGEWLPWLEASVEFSEKQAQRYMQLASHREELEQANPTCMSDLGVAAALKQIARPREPRVDVAEAMRELGGDQISAERLDSARDRLRAESAARWTIQQTRRRHRALELIETTQSKLSEAASGGLSDFSVSELLRGAATDARRAATALEELAFSFER